MGLVLESVAPLRPAWGAAAISSLGAIGRWTLSSLGVVGHAVAFLGQALARIPRRPLRGALLLESAQFIGNRSLLVIALTSAFTGLVLALQGYNALVRFGAQQMVGALVALSLSRELAPVLAALMVTARAGSAIAATLGNMRVTEQIDALKTMAINPLDYLVKPRIIAGLIALPLLTTLFTLVGLVVARFFSTHTLGLDPASFDSSVRDALEWSDIYEGLLKSLAFALLIVWIATYRGYHASGGAKGVGQATTAAVVETAVLILAVDYLLTALLF
ncbi:MAG: toluene transporter subunit: rane component of superfamily [Pseudomonadota bacterium]|jgi:phospholipid/cholesterol/gamma-HCH transport system permease protein